MQAAETMTERLRDMDLRKHPGAEMTRPNLTEDLARTQRRKQSMATAYVAHSSRIVKVDIPNETSGYSEGVSIRNNTSQSISIRGRDGSIIHLAPSNNPNKLGEGIYYTVGFAGSQFVALDTARHDNVRNLVSNRILELTVTRNKRRLDPEQNTTWYHLTIDELTAKGGTVYLEEIDKLVSIRSDEFIPDHPSTYNSMDDLIKVAMEEYSESTSGLVMFAVDNNDAFGKRYVNLNGNILSVVPKQDMSRKDGLYLKLNGAIGNNRQGLEFYEFSTLDDKCPIKFYPNIAEAQRYGNEVEAKRQDLELRKLDTELEVVSAKRDQNVSALEKIEAKDVVEIRSLERKDVFEARGLERKDMFEERKDGFDARSTERKDDAEETKAVIATVGAAVALGGIGYRVASGSKKVIGGGLFESQVIQGAIITSGLCSNTVKSLTDAAGNHLLASAVSQTFGALNPIGNIATGGVMALCRLFGD